MQTANDSGAAPSGKADRASILAEMATVKDDAPTPKPTAAEVIASAPEEVAEGTDPEIEPVGDAPAEPVKEPEVDPAAAKGLASVQKAEAHFRKQKAAWQAETEKVRAEVEKARAEVKAKEAEITARAKALEDFDRLKARAKYAPDEVLEALGLGADDFAAAARAIAVRAPEYANDPKAKEAVARMMREREAKGEIAKTGGEVAQLKAALDELRAENAKLAERFESRDKEAKERAAVDGYLDTLQKAVTPEIAPLVAKWAAKNPARVRQALHIVAAELAEENGEPLDGAAVVAEVERRRRAELEEDGIDLAALLGAGPAKKATTAPPKTLARSGGGTVTPKKPTTEAEEKAAILAAMRAGNLDD